MPLDTTPRGDGLDLPIAILATVGPPPGFAVATPSNVELFTRELVFARIEQTTFRNITTAISELQVSPTIYGPLHDTVAYKFSERKVIDPYGRTTMHTHVCRESELLPAVFRLLGIDMEGAP